MPFKGPSVVTEPVRPSPPSECELACQDAMRHVEGCPTLPVPALGDHPHFDPGDGRTECLTCGKWIFEVTHSCKGVPVTALITPTWVCPSCDVGCVGKRNLMRYGRIRPCERR